MCPNRAGSIFEEKYKHCYSENSLFFVHCNLQHTIFSHFLISHFFCEDTRKGHTSVKEGSERKSLTDANSEQ